MRLDGEEQEILAGKLGPVRQHALQHQMMVGAFFGAEDFVPVTQAHIMADTESLGEAGVRWLEGLAAAEESQRQAQELDQHKVKHATLIKEWEDLAETLQASD